MEFLGLLNYKSMNGYDLKRVFDKSINHIWMANLSQIYRELQALKNWSMFHQKSWNKMIDPDKKVTA
jgi:DNA-binding PadR family transcriptional regulator